VPDSTTTPFELESLTRAVRYQKWIYDQVAPSMGRRILEIGSGIGTMSQWLPVREQLLLSEADPALHLRLEKKFPASDKIATTALPLGEALISWARGKDIDTAVSFNVMEHIEGDKAGFDSLFQLLRESKSVTPKNLVCYVPAHQWAYGEMDRMFAHFRRYEHRSLKKMWSELAPDFSIRYRYMNLPGLLAWFTLGRVLKKKSFGTSSVETFERLLPIIRPIDDFLHKGMKLPFGQSLLMIATKH